MDHGFAAFIAAGRLPAHACGRLTCNRFRLMAHTLRRRKNGAG
jgi:hypothetical protein